jgi:SAM-dependent methyltransferase
MSLDIQVENDLVEIVRLTNKAHLLAHCLGGFLPGLPPEAMKGRKEMLSIACGPGEDMLELARRYPHWSLVGIDTRSAMLEHCTIRARKEQVTNVFSVYVARLTQSLPFADSSFDLVNLPCIRSLLTEAEWRHLLAECYRVLRPGGWIRTMEGELSLSNSPAQEELNHLYRQSMKLAGRSVSLSDRHLGWLTQLEPTLFATGFEIQQSLPHLINFSFGTPLHEVWKHDLLILARKYFAFILEMKLLTTEQVMSVQKQMRSEMNLPTFYAVQHFLTMWGVKQ